MAKRKGREGREPLDIVPVLEFYGLKNVRYRDHGWTGVKCPFHTDRTASARVTLADGGAFHCNGCDATGDAISLIINRGDAHDFVSAVSFYETVIGGSVSAIHKRVPQQPRRPLLAEPRDLDPDSDLLSARLRRRPRLGP